MRQTVLIASAAFWLAMGAIWSFAGWAPALAPEAANTIAATAQGGTLTAAEVAAHASADTCWLIIKGRVYDVTEYLDIHPADPDTILKYCGKDGTSGFETKDRKRARAHSAAAEQLLEDYFIGVLAGG